MASFAVGVNNASWLLASTIPPLSLKPRSPIRYEYDKIFTARRSTKARAICRRKMSVCPNLSVCHTSVFCQNGSAYHQTFSLSRIYCTILVFPYLTSWQYSDADSLTGRRMQEYEKNRDFRPVSRFISEMAPDRAIVTVEHQ